MVHILANAALLLLLDRARGRRFSAISKVGQLRPPPTPIKEDIDVAGAKPFPSDDPYEDDEDEAQIDAVSHEEDERPVFPAFSGLRPCQERVVVIGGGFAGLAAARDLLLSGHRRVTVVESRDEVGGRTATVEPTNGTHTWHGIDLGAQWILGSEPGADGYNSDLGTASAAHVLAALAGVPQEDFLDSWYPYGYALLPEDRAPSMVRNVSLEGSEQLFTPQEAVAEDFWAECQKNWVRRGHRMNRISKNWDVAFAKDAARADPFSAMARTVLTTSIQEQDYGASVGKNDMWAGGCWEGIEYTSDHNLRYGFKPVYEWMEADIEARGGTVLKNTRAMVVRKTSAHRCRRRNCVNVRVRDENTGETRILDADRVVSTVSLGVLQRRVTSGDKNDRKELLKFDPELPATQRNALESLSMGDLEKLVLFFPTMFWKRTRIHAERGFEGLYFLGQVPESLPEGRMKWAGVLFAVEHSSVVLWFSGDDVEEFLGGKGGPGTPEFEAIKADLVEQAMDAIRDLFENDERLLDVDGAPVEVEEPYEDLTVLTNWHTDKNFLGCYAYPNRRAGPNVTQYQQELGLVPDSYLYFDLRRNALFEGYSKDRLALGQPASEGPWRGRLFFAGEHTSLSATGLVHGAVESGKRAAIEVSDATTCGAPQVPKRVAVPYFESNATSREDATYQRWKEIRREPDWKMGYKQGYKLLGMRGNKEGYEAVGCTRFEQGMRFNRAVRKVDNFLEALDKLGYTQKDDNDYDENENWVGDYNCYIAHYNMWSWSDFQYYWETTWPLETLGYDADQWDYQNSTAVGPDPPFLRWWEDLTNAQKAAAGHLCYTQYTWDFWGTFCPLY